MRSNFRIVAFAFAATISSTAIAADPDWMKSVGEALGKTGTAMPGGIYRVGLPRSDLKVTLDGVEIKPALPGSPLERTAPKAWSWGIWRSLSAKLLR
jgi:hypothetical protein